jgi:hypothetical protein
LEDTPSSSAPVKQVLQGGYGGLLESEPQARLHHVADTQTHNIKDPLELTAHGVSCSLPAPPGSQRYFHAHVYGQHCVLSVDDDRMNQIVISVVLKPTGWKLMQAMSGAEALSMLTAMDTLPDIILLDLTMPGMSGDVVCRHVRTQYGAKPELNSLVFCFLLLVSMLALHAAVRRLTPTCWSCLSRIAGPWSLCFPERCDGLAC